MAVANGTVALEAGHAVHRYLVRPRPELLAPGWDRGRTVLALPLHHRMSEADADDVITAVRRVLGEAAG